MVFPVGQICYVPPARAVADTVRGLLDLNEVRAVVAAAVQRRKVQLWQLADELCSGPVQGTARLRAALEEAGGPGRYRGGQSPGRLPGEEPEAGALRGKRGWARMCGPDAGVVAGRGRCAAHARSAGRYISFLRRSRSKMLPSIFRRPFSQARAKLPGSSVIDTTTSLLAVNRT